jgi:hypothetical protein
MAASVGPGLKAIQDERRNIKPLQFCAQSKTHRAGSHDHNRMLWFVYNLFLEIFTCPLVNALKLEDYCFRGFFHKDIRPLQPADRIAALPDDPAYRNHE